MSDNHNLRLFDEKGYPIVDIFALITKDESGLVYLKNQKAQCELLLKENIAFRGTLQSAVKEFRRVVEVCEGEIASIKKIKTKEYLFQRPISVYGVRGKDRHLTVGDLHRMFIEKDIALMYWYKTSHPLRAVYTKAITGWNESKAQLDTWLVEKEILKVNTNKSLTAKITELTKVQAMIEGLCRRINYIDDNILKLERLLKQSS